MTNVPSNTSADDQQSLQERADALAGRMKPRGLSPDVRAGIQAIVGGQAATTAPQRGPSDGSAKGMQAMQSLVRPDPSHPDNVPRYSATYLLVNVIRLLRHGAIAKKLNFDTENLTKILQAVFSKVLHRKLSAAQVTSWINTPEADWPDMNIVLFNALGCTPESPLNEVKQKTDLLVVEVQRLEQLYAFDGMRDIHRELTAIKRGEKTSKQVIDGLPDLSATEKIKFDDSVLTTMLEEAGKTVINAAPVPETKPAKPASKTSTPIPPATPAEEVETEVSKIDFEALYQANKDHPVFAPFSALQQALKANHDEYELGFRQSFGGSDLQEVIDRIDASSDLRTGLGHELMLAAMDGKNPSALIEAVAKSYGLENDLNGLQEKLHDIYVLIGGIYPALLAINDPYRIQLEQRQSAKVDYDRFYESLGTDQESVFAYKPLYYLYGALHGNEDDYNKRFKEQYFNGMTLTELNDKLDKALGADLALKLEVAAKSDNFKTALIETIAKYYGLERDADGLQAKMKALYLKLRNYFPGTLDESDPFTNLNT